MPAGHGYDYKFTNIPNEGEYTHDNPFSFIVDLNKIRKSRKIMGQRFAEAIRRGERWIDWVDLGIRAPDCCTGYIDIPKKGRVMLSLIRHWPNSGPYEYYINITNVTLGAPAKVRKNVKISRENCEKTWSFFNSLFDKTRINLYIPPKPSTDSFFC
jgi:hypothetical protein